MATFQISFKPYGGIYTLNLPDEIGDFFRFVFSNFLTDENYPADAEINVEENNSVYTVNIGKRHLSNLYRKDVLEIIYEELHNHRYLLYKQYVLLHASGIYNKNEEAIIFVGGTKAGKSSLAMYLFHYGYGYLSDDAIPIEKNKKIACACPYFASLRVESLNLFEWLKQMNCVCLPRNQDEKFFYEYPIVKEWRTKRYKIRALVFSKYAKDGGNIIRRLPSGEIVRRLLFTCFSSDYVDESRSTIAILAQIPAYEMLYDNFEHAIELMKGEGL